MGASHMSSDDFRRYGHALIDWIAEYRERLEHLPVVPDVNPGDIARLLPASPPLTGEPFDAVLADVDRVVLPGITHWQSPSFFAYFPGNASEPSVLGELLAAGLGVQGMLWATSPAATEIEQRVLDWLVEMCDLPDVFRGNGVIQDSASSATIAALIAARERATRGDSNRAGARTPLAVYASREAHSSVEKGTRAIGIGSNHLRRIETDPETHAMRPDALARAIEQDRAAGITPVAVVATIGTTGTTAIDPLPSIAGICAQHAVWLHVDAAYAGTAAVCPELRWMLDGLDGASSYAFNPHKWMLTNFDCTAFYVAEREALVGALSVVPEYLRTAQGDSGAAVNYSDWHLPLGRRFRALKLWFTIRHYGVEGIRAHVRGHVAHAQEFAGWVRADDRFEVVAPHPLGLVCFRLRSGDEDTRALLEAANRSGIYLTHTTVGGALTLRLAIGAVRTERRHVERAWQILSSLAPR